MAFRSSASNAFVGSGGSTVTAAVPSGAQAGDIAIVWIYVANDSVTASATGWTALTGVPYFNGGQKGALLWLWKRLTAADSGNYTFQLSGSSGQHVAWTGLWSGRDGTDPFDFTTVNDIEADGDSGTTQPSELTGAASAGSDLVYSFSNYAGDTLTATDPTTSDTYTLQINESTTGNNLFTIDDVPSAATRGAQADDNGLGTGHGTTWWTTFAALKVSSGTEPVDAAFAGALALADAAAIVGDFEATAAGQMLGRTAAATAAAAHGSFAGIEAGQFTGALATATGSSTAGAFSRSISASFAGALATAEAAAIAAALDLTTAVEGPSATAIGRAVAGRFSGNGTVFPLTITGLAGPNLAHKPNGPGRVPDPKTTGPNVNGAATGPGIAYTAHGAGV